MREGKTVPAIRTRVETLDFAHRRMSNSVGWTLYGQGHRLSAADLATLGDRELSSCTQEANALGVRAVDGRDMPAMRMARDDLARQCEALRPYVAVTDDFEGDSVMIDQVREYERMQQMLAACIADDMAGLLAVATEMQRDEDTLFAEYELGLL